MSGFLLLAGVFSTLWVTALLVHRRRHRLSQATMARRLGVCAILVGAGMAPIALAIAVKALAPDHELPLETVAVFAATTLLSAIVNLGPASLPGSGGLALPELTDEAVLSRIGTLAALEGMKTPRVLVLSSAGGELMNQAFACGVVAPTLVVGDGVLHRLDPDERDAILGHELAHHSTGSIWALSLLPIVTACFAMSICAQAELHAAMAVYVLLFIGARRVVSRHFEVACDLTAARAVGASRMAAAIEKIHTGHALPEDSLAGRLAYATATHPIPAVRREALWHAAVAEDRDQIERDPPRAHSARRLARICGAIWVALVGLSAWLAVTFADGWAATLIGFTGALAPMLFLRVAIRDVLRVQRRRLRQRNRWGAPLVLVAVVLTLTGIYSLSHSPSDSGGEDELLPLMLGIAQLLVVPVLVLIALRRRTLNQRITARITAAMRAHDFASVLGIAEEVDARKQLDRLPALDHDVALARFLAGHHEEAVIELDRVARLRGAPPMAWLTLANVQLHRAPDRALAALEMAEQALPGDAGVDLVRARALIELGRHEEAESALERAATLRLQEPYILAARAAIALARGESESAIRFAREAVTAGPGAVYPQVVLAEVEASAAARSTATRRDIEAAGESATRALELAHANPYSLLTERAECLSTRDEEQETGAVPSHEADQD